MAVNIQKGNNTGRNSLYKKPIKKNNTRLECDYDDSPQELRRQRLLEQQKKDRDAVINAARGLLDDILNEEIHNNMEYEDVPSENISEMEVEKKKSIHHAKHRYRLNKKMLMLSEWMLEVPTDLAENWLMIPCPQGKRVLIVATRNATRLFCRKGKFLAKCSSILPGGSYKYQKNDCTILDAIWVASRTELYILDILVWGGQKVVNCEAECRFYLLKSRMEELNAPHVRNPNNHFSFLLLPTFTCDQNIYECLETFPKHLDLDGVLFYHKEGYYTYGKTPLVTWLKPYMLTEVLGVSVPEPYMHQPDDYISFENHVNHVINNEKKLFTKQKTKKKSEKSEELME